MSRPLLKLRKVEARYGRFVALHNVSLVVPEGSVVALLGPNGVGKTTLLRTVSGMLPPSAGEIRFDGRRIDGLPDHRISRLGLAHIPEGRGIFPGLTVSENLLMAGSGDGSLAHVFGLFPILEQRLGQLAGTLSGGEQQMLSLARAVLTRPRLLMVDELSLGLAPRLVAELFETLERIRDAGTTILLVEQYVRYAMRLADIIVILHKGRVSFIGEPGELSHSETLAQAYLGGTQAASAAQADVDHQPEPTPEPARKPRPKAAKKSARKKPAARRAKASGGASRAARRTRKSAAPRRGSRGSSRA